MYIEPSAITLPLAFIAGFFSFISPCVLPLVPAYIGYLAGQATTTVGAQIATATAGEGGAVPAKPSRWAVTLHGLFFVLGFSVLFVLLGFGAGALGQLSYRLNLAADWISRAGGVLVIILALHVMGVIRIPFLYYDTRRQGQPRAGAGYVGSFVMGVSFSAGWSPCLGPILAAMLTLGLSAADAGRAGLLLSVYALGLGIPFLLTALLLDRATGLLRRMQKHMRAVELVSGGLLLVIGVLLLTGSLQRLSAVLSGSAELSIAIDEWLVRLAGGGN